MTLNMIITKNGKRRNLKLRTEKPIRSSSLGQLDKHLLHFRVGQKGEPRWLMCISN
jgi:hypothetical protein